MNLFEFAMKMELDGKAYYEKLAAETAIEGLKTILLMLAADEQKHYEAVRDLQTNVPGTMPDSAVLEKAKNIFEGVRADKTVVDGMKKELDGYLHAMKIEADSVRLYEDMAKQEDNQDTVALLLRIANEEKKHYNIVQNLYEFGLKPEYYLEWVEFSNRERL
ncbi:MAG: ferritin [Geobacter sp.]|nr:MAG: ferritin [Geobacter sp.]